MFIRKPPTKLIPSGDKMFRKFLVGILTASAIFFQTPVTFATPHFEIQEEIYKWIQSTPRGNYWFNYQVMGYKVRPDDTLDLNILEVPALITYDNIQIEDVVQKRRWRGKSTIGYNDLIGRADYLEFNLKDETVTVVERTDLDHTFTVLDREYGNEPVKLSELSDRDISCKFYRAILRWAREQNDWIIRRSRGKLSNYDSKLSPQAYPIFKLKWNIDKK